MKEIQKIAVGESLLYSNAKRIISILKFGNFLIQIRIFGGGYLTNLAWVFVIV